MSPTKTAARPCTCHPDDNAPTPCVGRYALSECKAATVKESLTVRPVAWARKQDLLQHDPCHLVYASKPAAENGHEPVALYTEDQLLHELQRLRQS